MVAVTKRLTVALIGLGDIAQKAYLPVLAADPDVEPVLITRDPRRREELARAWRVEAGFAEPVYHWAEGRALEEVLEETEMAPGDFVRTCKQLVDLLRQIEEVADPTVAAQMRASRDAVLRGVVAYTGV